MKKLQPLAIAATSAVALVSFLLSFSGLVAAAPESIPSGLRWGVPVVVDGSILVYQLVALSLRRRGESARFAWLALSGFSAVSVSANAWHAFEAGHGDLFGAFLAAVPPVSVVLTSHAIARLVIDDRPAPVELEPAAPGALTDKPYEERPPIVRQHVYSGVRREPTVPAPKRTPSSPERDARVRAAKAERPSATVRELAAELGIGKSTVARILSES